MTIAEPRLMRRIAQAHLPSTSLVFKTPRSQFARVGAPSSGAIPPTTRAVRRDLRKGLDLESRAACVSWWRVMTPDLHDKSKRRVHFMQPGLLLPLLAVLQDFDIMLLRAKAYSRGDGFSVWALSA